ncbi:MAG: baseplate J/gp47 family protein, partial [Candidatus Levybacteria bacterium]|nr:baseplate J/gp47 family protein [Candidatus Levybacteria bacterium]
MKLPIPILGNKEKSEHLLALLLRQEKATAIIIEQKGDKSTIVGKHEEYFQSNLEDAAEEEWLKILDQTISKAEETLPPNVQTQKTIFGVPASWVEEKHIKKDYLLKLKKTSEELSLTPIGFLEIPEAIVHLLQEEEGAPVSAILVEIGKEYLAVSLVRGGKVIETKTGKKQETVAKDVDLLLRSFTNVEVFPSRIILFNGGFDEKLVQSCIAHLWSKSLPFLHVPKISILPQGFDAKSVVYGAAAQMGFDILGQLAISSTDIKTFHGDEAHISHEDSKNIRSEEKGEEMQITDEGAPKHHTPTALSSSTESFGFVKDVDVALSKETSVAEKSEDKREEEPEEDKEIDQQEKETKREEAQKPAFTVHSPYNEESNIKLPQSPDAFPSRRMKRSDEEREDTLQKASSFAAGLLAIPQSLLSLVPRLPRFGTGNRVLFVALPVLLLLVLGLIGAYVYFLHSTITITISPKEVDQNEDIVFATEGDNDFGQSTIAAHTTSIALSGSTNTQATGKKETGTKAKGTVTLFNSADVKKQLQEGTTIASSNNLEFTLDKDVTIASATGDIFSGIKSGTASVPVTAKQIGSEYNIPSNIKFSIGDNSSLAAKNDAAFSGGTKKNVTVVAKADIDKLTAALPKSLEEKARNQLSKKLSSSETLLTMIPDFKPSKKDFSADVGDEAKTVTLTSSVTYEGAYYDNADLLAFTKSVIKEKFDPNLTVQEKDIQNTIKNVKEKDDGTFTATLTMKARLLPKIEKKKLQKELSGKSFTNAKQLLRRYPQVEDVSITLFPPIPFLPEILPRKGENIDISVS